MNNEMYECGCGDQYPHNSFGAGFIAASGQCPNCDAGTPKKSVDASAVVLSLGDAKLLVAVIEEFCSTYQCDVDELLINEGEMDAYNKLLPATPKPLPKGEISANDFNKVSDFIDQHQDKKFTEADLESLITNLSHNRS